MKRDFTTIYLGTADKAECEKERIIMKKRKVAALLLTTVMAVSTALVGCESSDSGEASGSGDGEKIVIFQSKVEIVDEMQNLAEAYTEETGVEVEVWEITGDDYFNQLKIKLANEQGPTIMSMAPGAESKTMLNYIESLEGIEMQDTLIEGLADVIDGELYGLPYTTEGFGLVYNKDMADYESFADTDALISEMEKQAEAGNVGLGLSSESYFLIGHILNTPFALQENPEEFMNQVIAGEVDLKTIPEFQEFAEVYAAIRDGEQNPLEVVYDQECGDFATGKSSAIHQGNWSYNMFTDYEVEFEMGMAPLPLAGNDKLSVSVPTAFYVNSQASEGEKEAAKEFLNWLYTSDTGEDFMMNKFGFAPVVNTMTNENMDPLSQEVSRYVEEGRTIPWAQNHYPAGIAEVYLVPIAEQFFTTEMTNDELLDAIQQGFIDAGAE